MGTGGVMSRKRELALLFVVAFAVLVIAAPALAAGWTPQASGTTNDLKGVDSTGSWCWAVGSGGTILATRNGGSTWTAQTSGTTNDLNAVDFIDATRGWAVGSGGTILATSNGGSTWTAEASGTTSDLFAVSVSDASPSSPEGWAVGASGSLLRWGYVSGGEPVWSAVSSGSTNDLYAIGDIGGMARVAGGGGAILFNAGYPTWESEASGVTQALYSICWDERLAEALGARGIVFGPSCWAVGEQGTILIGKAGQPWVVQPSETTATLRGVVFSSGLSGWVVGDHGTILATSSGGWETIAPTTTASGVVDQRWYRAPLTVTFTATDDAGGSGVAYTEFCLDGGDWTKGTSVPVSGEGGHSLDYRSVDLAGNFEDQQTLLFGIDTVKPSTRAPSAATAARGRTATLRYRVVDAEPNYGFAKAMIKVKTRAGKVVKTMKAVWKPVNTPLTWKFTVPRTWKRGTYRFYLYATDRAGNTQANVASNRLIVK
jgi:photosystem II stability/assembly factor-like uncharacterized protein